MPSVDRFRPCLGDIQLARVVALGREVEVLFGAPVDVEWAVAGGEIWVLQARPVTADLPPPAAPTAGTTTLAGVPGSAGTATGPVRLVAGPADFGRVTAGDVIVCHTTDPAWTPLFAIAAGFVTETGGVLSHAAIVAREHRIPAVLGVAGAMTILRDGHRVAVDGTAGTVRSSPGRAGSRAPTA